MKIEKDKSLKELTTFKIGGRAQFFCAVNSEKDLIEALAFAKENNVPFFILGGGSNILVSDEGFRGLVIKMEIKGIEFVENGDVVRVCAMAGEDWDNFVGEVVKKGLYGIENLSLIPGTVGAAPVQNIGAYGSEVKDAIEIVRVYDVSEGKFRDLLNSDCKFEYRNSLFKKEKGRYVIVSVNFILRKSGSVNIEYRDIKEYFALKKSSLEEVRKAVIEIRTRKLPDVRKIGTAGSFFKNPIISHLQANDLEKRFPGMVFYPFNDQYVKVSLAWILDHVCGYRGKEEGNVGTYKNQALVIVNNGGATAKEVINFAENIKHIVKDKTGIDIEPEVEYID